MIEDKAIIRKIDQYHYLEIENNYKETIKFLDLTKEHPKAHEEIKTMEEMNNYLRNCQYNVTTLIYSDRINKLGLIYNIFKLIKQSIIAKCCLKFSLRVACRYCTKELVYIVSHFNTECDEFAVSSAKENKNPGVLDVILFTFENTPDD